MSERQMKKEMAKKKVKKQVVQQKADNGIIKSTAITLLKQKIGETDESIIKSDKYQDQSRFCYLQSSSSSSSEDLPQNKRNVENQSQSEAIKI